MTSPAVGASARTPTLPAADPVRRNRLYRHGVLELEDFPVERSGHRPMFEQPSEFHRFMVDVLERC